MTQHITDVQVSYLLHRINTQLGVSVEPWVADTNNVLHAQPGCHFLDNAYGGYSLRKLSSPDGGEVVITHGYLPKREVYAQMQAYLAGIMAGKFLNTCI
jgi:hypothetical protein